MHSTLLRSVSLVLALLVGCGRGEPPQAPAHGPRLVSLTPAITETVATLGATDALVGRSDWCIHPPEVQALPAVGSSLTPDLERIAGLQPTAILLDESVAGRGAELTALAAVEVLPWLTGSEVVASTRRLGELVHREEAAEALAGRLAALDVPAPTEGPSVLLVIGGEGLQGGEVWFVARNSLHGAALHAAGARNAVEDDVRGASTLSLEALVRLDPATVIVLTVLEADDEARAAIQRDWAQLETLQAVRHGRVGVVGGPLSQSTGPTILDLVAALRVELERLEAP